MPPFGASFTLEEGGTRGPVSRALTAAVAGVPGVVFIKFRVVDLWEDFE